MKNLSIVSRVGIIISSVLSGGVALYLFLKNDFNTPEGTKIIMITMGIIVLIGVFTLKRNSKTS